MAIGSELFSAKLFLIFSALATRRGEKKARGPLPLHVFFFLPPRRVNLDLTRKYLSGGCLMFMNFWSRAEAEGIGGIGIRAFSARGPRGRPKSAWKCTEGPDVHFLT